VEVMVQEDMNVHPVGQQTTNGRRRQTDDDYSTSEVLLEEQENTSKGQSFEVCVVCIYLIHHGISCRRKDLVDDDIRKSIGQSTDQIWICIVGQDSNKTVNYDSKTLRKSGFRCKLEEDVKAVRTSYSGRHMINQNYFAYSQR
jgi:hypothetical protein